MNSLQSITPTSSAAARHDPQRSVALLTESAGLYTLPKLSYQYSDMEPFIDRQTMELHHSKHHLAYVNGLNAALANSPAWRGQSIGELLSRSTEIPEPIRTTVLNLGGGHANHSLFWQSLSTRSSGKPTDQLADNIVRAFGSFDTFRSQFESAGLKLFGSGWVVLAVEPKRDCALSIEILGNQATLHGSHKVALLVCDVWEHAYYLKYQNRRAEWLSNWWNVANWDGATERYAALRSRVGRW